MSLDSLFESLQEEALPGIWSKGVALARDRAVLLERRKEDECLLRVRAAGKAVSPSVSVWPLDDDAHCDCGDRVEPCMHVVAAVVALKNGWIQAEGEQEKPLGPRLVYRFSVRQGALAFERVIISAGKEEVLSASLVSLVGGIGSGRIAAPSIPATRADYRVDQVISELGAKELAIQGVLSRRAIPPLLEALKDSPSILLDGEAIRIDPRPLRIRAFVQDTEKGVRLVLEQTQDGMRVFVNGALMAGGALRPLAPLSEVVTQAAGREFFPSEYAVFVGQLLPLLERETDFENRASKLPRLERVAPRVILESFRDPSRPEELEVMARLVYGAPIVAEVIEGSLDLPARASVIPVRDEAAEQSLLRELQAELHLRPRQRVRWSGTEAIDFLARSRRWEKAGEAAAGFTVKGELVPEVFAGAEGLRLNFALSGGGRVAADPQRVLAAWRSGDKVAPLLEGGWASIPESWLSRNMERLESLLALRGTKGALSVLAQVQAADFCSEVGGTMSPALSTLRARLVEFSGIPEQSLPSDLRAELRPYQRIGVNWLGFLRELGLGALLADDMGLGKTLQALCAVKGRTLVIAPTSVLPTWEEQIRRFRPGLRLGVYYGQDRRLEFGADITLTSYGVLRLDRGLLTTEEWDTIVLDEAQQIKNPDSQLARAAHELRAKFRIALTGTPIENRLDDLWSQIQFVQPGLLGTRGDFRSEYGLGMIEGFKRRIKPIILRRMKRDVAPELPPKTETVLYCDLSESEQSAYRTILGATRDEVVRELESGGSVLGALEALLRLRQICAHQALVPGLVEPGSREFSSKLELLGETLEESLALGHSVLIFSQWTGYLDWVEKLLAKMNVEFLRLDGSTRDRGAVIERFQDAAGPRVMILSLKAGGVGLTLTKADHVIILDPWWNPAVEDQAADRAHRIGQTQPVLVQRLVARETVEEKILQLQRKKQELAAAVLGSGEGMPALELTREDILALLR